MPERTSSPATLIFIHIPKTGGQSFNDVLARQYGHSNVRRIYGKKDIRGFSFLPASERNGIDLLVGHMGFGMHAHIEHPAKYVTFLRNPVELVVSTYYYIRSQPTHQFHRTIVEQSLSLKEFVERGVDLLGTDNGQTRILAGEDGIYCWPKFRDCNRQMLERAKTNLRDHFSALGLTEKFDESLVLFRRAFGWRMPFYRMKNKTIGRPRVADLEAETLALINEQNALDLELFRYAQQLFAMQVLKQGPSFKLELLALQWLNVIYSRIADHSRLAATVTA